MTFTQNGPKHEYPSAFRRGPGLRGNVKPEIGREYFLDWEQGHFWGNECVRVHFAPGILINSAVNLLNIPSMNTCF